MDAKEARAIADKHNKDPDISLYLHEIAISADLGEYHLSFNYRITPAKCEKLMELGYQVVHSNNLTSIHWG